LWTESYGGFNYDPVVIQWNDTGEHFIGVRLRNNMDTLYGWIRVEAAMPAGIFTLTIKDYSCNMGLHYAVPPDEDPGAPVIFPNPAQSVTRIDWREPSPSERTLSFFTTTGELVSRIIVGSNQTGINVNVSSWQAGLYLLRIETNGKTATRRVEIIR
jgi:hypothetical protein